MKALEELSKFSHQNEQLIPPIESLPGVFRIDSINFEPRSNGKGYMYTAVLYHDQAAIGVSFTCSQPDIRLKPDMLVSVRWNVPVKCNNGFILISRLVLLERPVKGINIFHTVLHRFVPDRNLVKQAAELFDDLPDNMQDLVRSIFWDGQRFRRFCNRPASLTDHHAITHGNLQHTIEVVQTIKSLAGQFPLAHVGIAMAAGFLHDAGKAVEYNPWSSGQWGLTDRGRLLGHRTTILEWIAIATATNRCQIPQQQYLSLMHALSCGKGAEWLGVREPSTPEATLLSMADRLSGEKSLLDQYANNNGGWGQKLPHRRVQPFTIQLEPQKEKVKTQAEQLAKF
jgi:3'-5' exoribonuclease